MRLDRARRVCSHLAVGCAFASMTVGGEVPAVAVALFGLAWGLSLLFEGRLGSPVLYTALTAIAFVALVASWLTGAVDLVVAAALFAAAVAANRLLARRAPADDGLLHLAALMMLAGGAALCADLLYGFCFAGFALSIAAALTLSHLERVAEEAGASAAARARLASPRLLGSLGALSAAGLAGAVGVFFTFPRVTTGFYTRARQGPFGAVTGFSGQVRLDGRGMLKSDPRVVARVRVEPDPGTDRLGLRWRGRALERFDGKAWTTDGRATDRARRFAWAEKEAGARRLSVEVLASAGTRAVFVTGAPTSVSDPRRVPPRPRETPLWLRLDRAGNIDVDPAPEDGYSYELRAYPEPEPDSLEHTGDEVPDAVRARYLQLPDGLDPRIAALARQLTEGLESPLRKARAVERALQTQYAYTTALAGPVADPLANFLFERRQGHCEFFSSAMTVMLRAVGVPARNVVGFFGGERGVGADYFVLRAGDAHSWTEAWVPGRGFVAFDPTPAAGRLARPIPGSALLMELLDRLSSVWQRHVVELTLWDQMRAARTMLDSVSSGLQRLQGRSGAGAGRLLRGALAAAALALAGLAARPLLRRVRCKPAPRPVPPHAAPAAEVYRALLKRLARRGLGKRPGQTARDWVRALEAAGQPSARAAGEVVEWYLAARFGRRTVAPAQARAMRARVARL